MDTLRIDKWLWHMRIVKTRTAASALVSSGRIRLNGTRISAPSHVVKAGDVLTVALDQRVRLLRVEAFAERRGDRRDPRCRPDAGRDARHPDQTPRPDAKTMMGRV